MSNIKFQQVTIDTKKVNYEDINKWLQLNGALAISILDAGDEPIYEPPPDAMPLWDNMKIVALFNTDKHISLLINKLNYAFSDEIVENYTVEFIDKDYTNQSYDFEPICFANKLWIYPYNKHPDSKEKDRAYINLEPGLAFGSGEHPTTALCLEWLANNLDSKKKQTVIDYGSGSGILSLAAIKLGAGSVLAVDNDPQAILATRENSLRNKIAEQISTFMPSELPFIEADFVVANILANPLVELAPIITSHLKTGGNLVLSGILNEQSDMVALAYMSYGITITDITKKGAWVRIAGKK